MEKITYAEMKERMCAAFEAKNYDQKAVIVFKPKSFKPKANGEPYTVEECSYIVRSDAKIFNPRACGYSMFGSCLDGKDSGVALTNYIDCEYGKDFLGDKAWEVDYCYMVID